MSKCERIRANGNLLALDYIKQMFENAERGVSVTPYVFEGDGTPGNEHIEFELRVTRIGKTRISATRTPTKSA